MEKSKATQVVIPFDKVSAQPTKKFFVEMLTRDIELVDAIMDLIDNCIDGVHRQRKNNPTKEGKFYNGFKADILISEKSFSIKDNCGGIPEDVARNYAFKMGRDDAYDMDENLETVGVYGIGMKRAIFKMGSTASVTSHHDKSIFRVTVPKNWASIADWYFDFEELSQKDVNKILPKNGTFLEIKDIHKNIKKSFEDKAVFLKDLNAKLRNHYGYIIEQGFSITLNTVKILPLELNVLVIEPSPKNKIKKAIVPYIYKGNLGEVDIEVIVGFYRPPAEQEELDQNLEGSFAKSTSVNAGVTVLCNDRIVLYGDKSPLTGWGESPVPNYHTQFINIIGIVHFRSKTPIALPLTTTKRGLDTSSPVYASTRAKIRQGLKIFTSFTNYWKTPSEERSKLFKDVKRFNALMPGQTEKHFAKTKKDSEGEYQIPDLPRPNDEKRDSMVTISFTREKEKVEEMREYFFDGEDKPAAEVGSWCFDQLYSKID